MKKFYSREINSFLSYSASLLFHIFIFLIAYYFTNLQISRINLNSGYVQVFTSHLERKSLDSDENILSKSKEIEEDEKSISNKDSQIEDSENQSLAEFVSFLDTKADTISLQQVYSETSLNVMIKYPAGWTFLDQNVDNKLDGVTFWTNSFNITPPPYVHLEVCDKELFIPNRFKHNLRLRDAVMYFNEPDSLANYYTQTFYFRTEINRDFSIKLTIRGKEAFEKIKPIFYGMLKSFRFGNQHF